MKNWTRLLFAVAILIGLAVFACAIPLDFDTINRDIPLQITFNPGDPLSSQIEQPIVFKMLQEPKNSYGLRISGQSWGSIFINGNTLDIRPVTGEDGIYYMIPADYLKSGSNEMMIHPPIGQDKVLLTSIMLFELKYTDEEAHFSRVFGVKPAKASVQPATHPSQLLYDMKHLILNHQITMTSSRITANATLIGMSLDSTNSLQTIVLDFDNNSGSFSVKSVDRGPGSNVLTWSTSGDWLSIGLPQPLLQYSMFTVRVFYAGTPDPNKIFSAAYIRTTHGTPAVPLVYSFSEPYGARQWFPCKDIPDDKFTCDLYWSCPTAYFPVSNGLLVGTVTSGSQHTFHYKEDYPISSYLVSVACTNYRYLYGVYTSLDGNSCMTVGNYIYPERVSSEGNGVNGTIAMIKFFSSKFGEYPFLKEKYTVATHNDSSSMEHQTATSLGPGLLSPDGRGRTNCHELSHQWFGDGITMRHFDHLWLNEGFATYAEALWVENQYGTYSYFTYVNAWTTADTYPIISSSADNFSGSIVYRKGGWVLHMLRKVMGDEPFFQGLKSYFGDTTLLYGNALTPDFQGHMENALSTNTSLSWFFNEWLYQAVRPAYNLQWGQYTQDSSTRLMLRISQTQSGSQYIMPIDIKVNFSDGSSKVVNVWNTQYATQEFNLDLGVSKTISGIVFDPDNWILDTVTTVPVNDWAQY